MDFRLRTLALLLTAGLIFQLLVLLAPSGEQPTVIVLSTAAAVIMTGTGWIIALMADEHDSAQAGPASLLPEQQARAFKILADMPQWLALKDGSLVDMVAGLRVSRCGCRSGEPHLALYRGHRRLIAFLTDASLRKFVSTQEAIANGLRSAD